MEYSHPLSKHNYRKWLINTFLLFSGLIAFISGIYFLFLPTGGYQGGRNPAYGIQILFDRQGWNDIHTWSGVAMILIATLHFSLHWDWVLGMAKRTIKNLGGQHGCLNLRGRINLIVDVIIAISFMLTSLSGIYFLLVPGSARSISTGTALVFSARTWDIIHTWAGVFMIIAAGLHLIIHWLWIVKVTRKVIGTIHPLSGLKASPSLDSLGS